MAFNSSHALLSPLALLLLVAASLTSAEQLCSSCPCLSESLLATDGGGSYSCGARVTWVMSHHGVDQTSACQHVSNEFPTICVYDEPTCETSHGCGGTADEVVVVVQENTTPDEECPKLAWSDEFSGTALDATKWSYQTGDGCDSGLCGWGNNELEWYQSDNVKVSSGLLVIEARQQAVGGKQYTSGRIRTKGLADFQYGRLEALIKIPKGNGIWPAFWMLPTDEVYGGWPMSGEIDIMEAIGKEPSKGFGTLHYGPAWPNNKHQGSAVELLDKDYFADKFHEFAVDWVPGAITWSIDGASYLTLNNQTISPWPFDERFHFLLNVAVGGNWPGVPDASTSFPQQMQVDYVRVYDTSFGRLEGPRYLDSGAKRIKFRLNAGLSDYTFSWSLPSGVKMLTSDPTSSKRIVVNWGIQSGHVSVTAKSTKCGVTKTFTLAVNVVQADPNSAIQDCSCPKCNAAVLHRMAGDYSCLDRMEWTMQANSATESEACSFVGNEFPAICGPECDPSRCNDASTQPQMPPQAMPIARCARQIAKNCNCEELRTNKSCWMSQVESVCVGSILSHEAERKYAERAVSRAFKVCLRRKPIANR